MAMASSSRSRAATGSSSLPVGYRFLPTEEELVSHYLKLKLQGLDSHASDVIPELDVCKFEPWDLPAKSLIKSDDEEWFFFSRRDHKYNNSKRANRSTEKGHWKITGKERSIKARATNAVIGKKRTLIFRLGRVRDFQKTNWVIHEYYIPENLLPKQRNFVLCRLKKNQDESTDIGLLRANARSNNDYDGLQSGANESEDDIEFVNSLLVDPNEDIYEETMQTTLLNESSLPKSLIKVCAEEGGVSSDTDTEIVHGPVFELQSGQADDSNLSRRDKDVILRNQFSRQNASSVKVAPEKPMAPIYPTYERTRRSQSLSRSVNILQDVSSEDDMAEINCLEADMPEIDCHDLLDEMGQCLFPVEIGQCLFPAEGVPQRKAEQAAERLTAINFPQKKQSITKFDKDKKVVAQGNNAEMGMKQTLQYGTTASNDWKGSIIVWEISPLSPKSNPPSVYVCNIVLGIILFIVVVREVVLYGNWC